MWAIEYVHEAVKQLKSLPASDRRKVITKLEKTAETENPTLFPHVNFLAGKLKGFYRLRVSNIRVIFQMEHGSRTITVFTVLHRKNAYRKK
ncbi:MAG: hypothetical protein COZ15_02840 [Elusimicrobia bacterium CG_4_10_14_3_um_filter_49_12_50_7]|nr:MAG: hypothetical protein COZ15_02840 [Elusimicrobia bacterium CG_4_10_14_3_um_filter_49_12_50_7]